MLRLSALFLLLTLSSSAQRPQPTGSTPVPTPSAPTPNPQWDRVAALPPGEPIAVLEPGRRYPVPCRIDWVDEASLACVVYAPYSAPRRTVYPIGNIAAVYSEQPVEGPGTAGLILGTAIGGGIGAILCSGTDALTALACAGVGGLVGLGAAAAPHPTLYPQRPRTRLRLIYGAP